MLQGMVLGYIEVDVEERLNRIAHYVLKSITGPFVTASAVISC